MSLGGVFSEVHTRMLRHHKSERATSARGIDVGEGSAHQLGKPQGQGQPEANGRLDRGRGPGAHVGLEDGRSLLGGDSRTVVGDVDPRAPVGGSKGDGNGLAPVAESVCQQVPRDLANTHGIGIRQCFAFDNVNGIPGRNHEVTNRCLGEVAQIDRFREHGQVAILAARSDQKILDQVGHLDTLEGDHFKELITILHAELVASGSEFVCKAPHGGERRSEFMAHGCDQLILGTQ